MGTSKYQTWIAGTVVLALLILVATWFLLVSPRRAQTDEAHAANDAALMEQDVLRARLATLQEQATHIEEYEAEIEALKVQIPSEPQINDYVRALQGLADQYGVVITAVSPSYPVSFAEATDTAVQLPVGGTETPAATDPEQSAENTAETADAASDATQDAADGATAEPAPTPEPTLATTGLFAIPLGVQVVGTYANVNAFLEGVQTQTGRVYLFATLGWVAQEAQDAQAGRPATAPGDVELTYTGFLFEYIHEDTGVPAEEEPATEPAPLPTSDRNPFASVAGS